MYKFRTMVLDAEENGPRFAAENDSRLIRGGAFCGAPPRRDPQLYNVLIGDMSLVGRAGAGALRASVPQADPLL